LNIDFKANLALIIAMMIWASSFVALKYSFASFDPFVVIFGRMAVASLLFLIFLRSFLKIKLTKTDIKYILLMSIFEPCLYFIFEAIALENTSASSAGMITALLPLMVSFGAWMIFKETITKNMLFGFALAIFGAIWLSLGSDVKSYAPNPLYGNFMEFMAMVTAVGYTLCLKHLSAKFDPFFLTATQAFLGALFYFPVLFFPSTTLPTEFPLYATLGVVYLGSFVTIGAYGLYNYGVSKIPASLASSYINLIPAFTVIFAYVLLDERLGYDEVIASIIIFIGVFVSQYRPKKVLPNY
jgi:drug/metabolite transporter (DMT)-like permease